MAITACFVCVSDWHTLVFTRDDRLFHYEQAGAFNQAKYQRIIPNDLMIQESLEQHPQGQNDKAD